MSDFIDQFMAYSEGALSPPLFRLWSGISLVAGALERRVWSKNGQNIVYPNLFVLLVGLPGTGKYIIEDVGNIWREVNQPGTKIPALHVAPNSMTKAALVDQLSKSTTTFLATGSAPYKYNSLLVAAEEFPILLPAYDLEYIATLNGIWNNPLRHQEDRRHGRPPSVTIDHPQLNILGGAQPAWMASIFPEEAWMTGIGRRLIMIYGTNLEKRSLFYEADVGEEIRGTLIAKLGQLTTRYGQVRWAQPAASSIDKWFLGGEEPVPKHSKLTSYNTTRRVFAMKLSIVSSLSRSDEMIIQEEDVERGLGWLLGAERVMPDIFRAMIGKSDKDIIEELHLYVTAKFSTSRSKVPGDQMRRFLMERVPHEKIESIIQTAERANIIARIAGTQDDWVPRARYDTGME